MFEEIQVAIEQENYEKALTIINKLEEDHHNNLWIRYYQSLILEKQGNLNQAENNYRQIIKDSIYPEPKLIKLIRDGIERIVTFYKIEKKEKINSFKNNKNSDDLAVLILEKVNLEEKKLLAQKFAKIMNIDNYTATLQIPTRSWRIYKTGNLGELNYYQSELYQGGIPCFCHSIKDINQMNIYQVKYIISDGLEVNILVENDMENESKLTFKWEEINNKIEGLIPIFEFTTHVDIKGKLQKKKSILDYAQFYDLHLLSQNLILRFSNHIYKFEEGLNILQEEKTAKEKWQTLINFLEKNTSNKPLWSDFNLFAEGVVQFPEMLKQIKAHIKFFRREESIWDEAFQLYSGLIFLQSLIKLNNP